MNLETIKRRGGEEIRYFIAKRSKTWMTEFSLKEHREATARLLTCGGAAAHESGLEGTRKRPHQVYAAYIRVQSKGLL